MTTKVSEKTKTTVLAPSCRTLAAWSRRELGLADAVGRKEIGMQVLVRLQNDGWLPSSSVQYAVETLSQSDDRLGSAALPRHGACFFLAEERHQREFVERFAREFFLVSPDDRRARWATLVGACAEFPRLVRRLRSLEAGLEVNLPKSPDDPPMCELAEYLGELFTATPAGRTTLRLSPPDRYAATSSQWGAAARRLKQQFPNVAALDAKFLSDLSWGLPSTPLNLPSVTVEDSSRPPTSMRRSHYDYQTEPVERGRRRHTTRRAGMGGVSIGIVLIMWIGRYLTSSDFSRTPTSHTSPTFDPQSRQSAPFGTDAKFYYQDDRGKMQRLPTPSGGLTSPVNRPGVPSPPDRRRSSAPSRPAAPSPGPPLPFSGRR